MKITRSNVQKTKTLESNVEKMRHTASHVLAAAVLKLYPETKLGIGPVIDNGFYYDFKFAKPISAQDLPKIEAEMKQIIKQDWQMKRIVLSKVKALALEADQPYKKELISEIPEGEEISFYVLEDKGDRANKADKASPPFEGGSSTLRDEPSGSDSNEVRGGSIPHSTFHIPPFIDLCAGPHVKSSGEVKAFKLTHLAGAYWKSSEKNQMLTRIYGLAFDSQEELDKHLSQIEEAKKRDHKILGKQLKIFTFSPLVGSGLPLYLPAGTVLRENILSFITELKKKRGYQFVWTPHLAKEALYVQSGHLGKYDAMLPSIITEEKEKFVVKPMNCPHHFQIYNDEPHSYKELPFRIAENATDYRNEKSGELNGLLRVRSLTMDDTHHVVRHDQIASEIDMILGLAAEVYKAFGFKKFRARISTRDLNNKDKYFGTDELWEKAELALVDGVKRWGVDYFMGEGEAAFYGPKIDVMIEDAIGREWQLTTVQLDYVQPENFDMTYTDEKGEKARPAILHVAVLGSLDRFLAIAIEHYAGAFPLWLAPEQVVVLPISEKHQSFADQVVKELTEAGIRVKNDNRNESLGKRIRENEISKIPYILVIGDKETLDKTVAIRHYADGDRGTQPLEQFKQTIVAEIAARG